MVIEAPDLHWPARDADERTTLEGFLDAYRTLAVRKCAGLEQRELAIAIPPSTLTLGGILKHLAACEDDWFHSDLAGHDFPEPWASVPEELVENWEWTSSHLDSPEELLELFEAACPAHGRRVRRSTRSTRCRPRPISTAGRGRCAGSTCT